MGQSHQDARCWLVCGKDLIQNGRGLLRPGYSSQKPWKTSSTQLPRKNSRSRRRSAQQPYEIPDWHFPAPMSDEADGKQHDLAGNADRYSEYEIGHAPQPPSGSIVPVGSFRFIATMALKATAGTLVSAAVDKSLDIHRRVSSRLARNASTC